MSKVQGHCEAKFEEVRALLQTYVESGEECGAAVAVNLDGENVIDIWAGYRDEAKTQPWEKDTLVCVWSCTKNVTNLATLMAIDRGLFDPTTKVSKVWPEFAANGKADIEVRMIMSHTSGLSSWEKKVERSDTQDTKRATALLAQQAPLWAPGTASGYHAITQGHLLGEIIKRSTGKSLTQFTAEDIAIPLKADFQIGCRETDWPRVAPIIPLSVTETGFQFPDPASVAFKTFTNPPPDANQANTAEFRLAEMGGSNGHTNARALTKILSVISMGGEVDGLQLLKPETLELIFQEQAFGVDLAMGVPIRFGIGYALHGEKTVIDWLPGGKICYWGGWGGSMVIMDCSRRLTISYVMNKMGPGGLGNDRTVALVKAIYQALGVSP